MINFKDIVTMIPDFINLFLSGFIFVKTFDYIESKKTDVTLLTVWSLFISLLIKSFYTVLHDFIFSDYIFSESLEIIILSLTGFFLAIIFFKIEHSKIFSFIFYKINNKTINDDIFRDLIDNDKTTTMRIRLKGSDFCYIGRFSHREECGLDSWISLINYSIIDTRLNVEIFNTDENHDAASIVLNLRNIETIEIFYDDNSKVWENLIEVK